jgi:hypothetical protein
MELSLPMAKQQTPRFFGRKHANVDADDGAPTWTSKMLSNICTITWGNAFSRFLRFGIIKCVGN